MFTQESIIAIDAFVTTKPEKRRVWNACKRRMPRGKTASAETLQHHLQINIERRTLRSFLQDNKGVNFESTDSLRELAVRTGQAYLYAKYIDEGPHELTRKKCLKTKPYHYARFIDKCPRDDTRNAAIENGWGYKYALYVDKCARDDTRKGNGYFYARDIDKGVPHNETRAVSCKERMGYAYASNIDRCRRKDTAWASSDNPAAYAITFDNGLPTPATRYAVKFSSSKQIIDYINQVEIPVFEKTGKHKDEFWKTKLGEFYLRLGCKTGPIVHFMLEVQAPADDFTRKLACRKNVALAYAMKIDKGPHDLTRASVSDKDALTYALSVDGCPHPDTFFECASSAVVRPWSMDRPFEHSLLHKYIKKFGQPSEWLPNFGKQNDG